MSWSRNREPPAGRQPGWRFSCAGSVHNMRCGPSSLEESPGVGCATRAQAFGVSTDAASGTPSNQPSLEKYTHNHVKFDYCVVGAGPAGAASATHLARAGHRVVLVDKSVFPRNKTCGDGLTSLAIRELSLLGPLPEHLPSWRYVRHAILVSAKARRLDMSLESGPPVAIARRFELDDHLVQQACRAGAELLTPTRVEAVEVGKSSVRVSVDGGATITVDGVVAADGAYSTVRRLVLAERRSLPPLHAIRQYGTPREPELESTLRVDFLRHLRPGYAWSFPLSDGTTNAGIMVHRKYFGSTRNLAEVWRQFESLGVAAPPAKRPASWPIPARIEPSQVARGRILFVGDAGGMADPLTGEGIGQALLSGRLAAQALTAQGDPTPVASEVYRSLIRRHLYADHVLSRSMIRAVAHSDAVDAVVRGVGMIPGGSRLFARWMFEEIPRSGPFQPCGLLA